MANQPNGMKFMWKAESTHLLLDIITEQEERAPLSSTSQQCQKEGRPSKRGIQADMAGHAQVPLI